MLSRIAAIVLVFTSAIAHGQQQSLADVYKQAISCFGAGDYASAITGLNSVLKGVAPDSPQLETIYFTLGAAHFNNKDFPDAVNAFAALLEKFPDGTYAAEAKLSMAQAQLQAGDHDGAIKTFKELEKNPKYREQALLFQARAAKDSGRNDEAITLFEKLMPREIRSTQDAEIATELVSLNIQQGLTEKAASLLEQLQSQVNLVENVVNLNTLTLALGDKLLSQGKHDAALACFREVMLKGELARSQEKQISSLEKRIAANIAAIHKDPTRAIALLSVNNRLRQTVGDAKKSLEQFEKTPEVVGALYLRIAQCFDERQEFWNAIVVYNELLARTDVPAEREAALFSLATDYAQAGRLASAQSAAEKYLQEFPREPNVAAMSYLRADMALRQKKYDEAEGMFAGLLESDPKGTLAQQIRILLGNSKFSQGEYDAAIEQYQKYLTQFPKGELIEEAKYRIDLALLFAGKYDEAVKAFRLYIEQNPEGSYVADAQYRLAVCGYVAQDYEGVIEACKTWRKQHPEDPQNAEISSLLGDSHAALGKTDKAIEAYRAACERQGASDEVLNYSIVEAAKLLQREARWEELSGMFEKFVSSRPDHPTVATALFWIGKAKARLGRQAEAREFLAKTVVKYIDDPIHEAAEPMLSQLAEILAKNPDLAKSSNPEQELRQLLHAEPTSATRAARILYAESEFARIRKDMARRQELLRKIVKETPLDDMSPLLLGLTGDQLRKDAELVRSEEIYQQLLDYYPKSLLADYAYAGLGEIALDKKEYPRALQYFTDGLQKLIPAAKLKELTLGQAKALLALGKLEEARKLFEQVASTREWRGEATAESLFALGDIQWRQEKWAEANAFFQRVFVSYGKFPEWVARSYLRSAECFVKLGKNTEATNMLKEMLGDDRLASLPETQTATNRLKQISVQ